MDDTPFSLHDPAVDLEGWISSRIFLLLPYALQFVHPIASLKSYHVTIQQSPAIASLKSYHVTIQQSPVSDPPTEWKLYRIMPPLTPSYDARIWPVQYNFCTVVITLWIAPYACCNGVVIPHGITSQRRDITPPLLIVLNMTSYNGFAAKLIKNVLNTLNKVNF
jgi:hypothetical protein